MFSFDTATYGFETAKDILGVGSNGLNKLIDQNLLSVLDDGSGARNQRYSGWDIGFLASARNRPLLVADGELALVCSMGREPQQAPPSLYFDATWQRFTADMRLVQENVSDETWDNVLRGEYRVTGHWRVKREHVAELEDHHGIVVASYAGFILDGGRIVECVPNVLRHDGGRVFIVKPFNIHERHRFAHNYLRSRQGPPSKVWTAEELQYEAQNLAQLEDQ